MAEKWKPVVGFEGLYSVSSGGKVRSSEHHDHPRRKTRILFGSVGYNGYLRVTLTKDGRPHYRSVHCLVAEAFIGPRPHGAHVHHVDGDKLNNAASNLVYMTASEHVHAGHQTKITEDHVRVVRLLVKLGYSQRYAGRVLGLNHNAAHAIMSGKLWRGRGQI